MPKQFNLKYFESIKPQPMKRYALWLIESPGYGYSLFEGMKKSIAKGPAGDDEMHEWETAYPEEFTWFTKHLEKHPDAEEVQKQLFNIHN